MNGYCNNSAIVWNITVLCYQNDYQMHDRLEFLSLTRGFEPFGVHYACNTLSRAAYCMQRTLIKNIEMGQKPKFGIVLNELW